MSVTSLIFCCLRILPAALGCEFIKTNKHPHEALPATCQVEQSPCRGLSNQTLAAWNWCGGGGVHPCDPSLRVEASNSPSVCRTVASVTHVEVRGHLWCRSLPSALFVPGSDCYSPCVQQASCCWILEVVPSSHLTGRSARMTVHTHV